MVKIFFISDSLFDKENNFIIFKYETPHYPGNVIS